MTLKAIFSIVFWLVISVNQLPSCYAQETSIKISSLTQGQYPKIIISSKYDFEKEISLKVRPDPRFIPSDVLIKTISEMGMHDAKGISITSGFDIDLENDLVLAFSGGSSEIIKANQNVHGLSVTASFKDRQGSFVSPPIDSLALYTTGGDRLAFEYTKVTKAPPKMAFILLLDRSGSMKDVIEDVQTSAQDFLKILPDSAKCAVASFNGTSTYHNDYYQSCNKGDFHLNSLKAGGSTDLYTPLLNAYESLSRASFKGYQKAVILITDGQIPPDEGLRTKLLSAKQDVLAFVYFLGEKNDEQLIGLANAFLAPSSDIKASLDQYFGSLGSAYNNQTVLKIKRTEGGDYAKAN